MNPDKKRKPNFYIHYRKWQDWAWKSAHDKASSLSDNELVHAHDEACVSVGSQEDHIIGEKFGDNEDETMQQILRRLADCRKGKS